MFNDLGFDDFANMGKRLNRVEQIDDLNYSIQNGFRQDVLDWLSNECSWQHKLEGYQDGLRIRITFEDKRGAVEFKLRWVEDGRL